MEDAFALELLALRRQVRACNGKLVADLSQPGLELLNPRAFRIQFDAH